MGCFNSLSKRHFWSYFLTEIWFLVIFVCVQGQNLNPTGYINIDCGLASNTSYVHSFTGLTYVSDDEYIDIGNNSDVSLQYIVNDNYTDLNNLRSFPSNTKSCYTLKPVAKGLKYLVRATFYYGNYDKKGKPPNFNLYFGVNFWSTVNITRSDSYYPYEIIAIAPANYIQVCLVNTGHGTPFISVLELRPINSTHYQADSEKSLNRVYRNDIGSNYTDPLRYPKDSHDRLWYSWTRTSWTALSTTSSIDGFEFEVPSLVLQTAAVPSSPKGSIEITWSDSDKSTSYFVVLHFAELQVLQNNSLREFYIYANGELVFKDAVPLDYLTTTYAYYTRNGQTDYNMSLVSSARATLPPIINAFELYTVVPVTFMPTDNGDVTAINSIKTSYSIRKDWSGDPCVPTSFGWTGVNCSIDSSNIPRITALTLSSSGLKGTIISDFGSLIALERLDLSHNYLSGKIPDSLDQLASLTYLDLSGNSGLSKTLPPGLQKKQNDRHLTVISDDGTGHKKSSNAIIIIVAVVIVFLIVGAAALLFWYLKKKKKNTRINPPSDHVSPRNIGPESSSHVDDKPKGSAVPDAGRKELNFNKKRFSFAELKHVTNNFRDLIGVGGFGEVFKGCIEDRVEVAVKVRSESSSQGIQQFLNEVEKLSRVHHKNLVSLIGYCEEGNQIALVYEYMQKGNLQDWIRGSAHSLPWKQRLRIAYESAQGLEYLHKMCNPPLIHRDIKTSNILLSTNLEAKVSDFGLVRDCSGPHVTTKVVGTPGYLDPYYASTSQLTEKSDVFSFGVILLELITGKSPVVQGQQGGQHLTQFVQQRLSKGKIESIVDSNMGGQYNINSIWKVADMALRCTNHPANRPDMTAIVTELKETLHLEMSSMEASSVASEDISQSSGNFEMAHIGGMQIPDYGPLAR